MMKDAATGEETREVSRRRLLGYAIGGCIALIGGLLGVPAVGAAIGPALRRSEAPWVDLGPVDKFPEAEPTVAQVQITRKDGWIEATEAKTVWVIRQGGDFVVFNGRCTHLGCAFAWQADRREFACPCHGGRFGKDGRVLGGPPPRSLDPLPSRVDNGVLQAQYMDFRLGVAERKQT